MIPIFVLFYTVPKIKGDSIGSWIHVILYLAFWTIYAFVRVCMYLGAFQCNTYCDMFSQFYKLTTKFSDAQTKLWRRKNEHSQMAEYPYFTEENVQQVHKLH